MEKKKTTKTKHKTKPQTTEV